MKGFSKVSRFGGALVMVGFGVLGTSGCSKVKALLGHGDGGAETAAGGGALPTGKGGSGPLGFLNGFEGEIDVQAKGKDLSTSAGANTPVNVALLLKDGKIRADMPPGLKGAEQVGKAYAIFDGPAKKLSIVMDAQKQAIVIDLNKTGDHLKTISTGPHLGGGTGGTAPSKPPPKVTKTGKTDKVAGYSCELWDITDESTGSKAEMCIASEGVSWFSIPFSGAPAEFAWMSELLDGKHFPLRFVGTDKSGAEQGRVEVTKIDKKSEAASQFEIPAGYKIVTIEQLLAPGGAAGFAGGLPPSAAGARRGH